MSDFDPDMPKASRPPRTATVMVFLAAGAVILSYLGVYALTNALVTAEVIAPWRPGADPRPRWMLQTFGAVFCGLALVGFLMRWWSNRQLRAIDASADAE